MRVLVTGAGGFVGQYLCRYLHAQGDDVFGIIRGGNVATNYCVGDILDRDFISRTVREVKPDYVFHLAGYASVKNSFQNPDLVRMTNVEGTRNLLDALQVFSAQARFLYVSSAVVYDSKGYLPVTEDALLAPASPYALSRLEAEKLLVNYNIPWIVARSFNHTGPGQNDEYVLSDWCRQAAAIELGQQEPIIQVGNINSVRDFLDVRDIVVIYRELLNLAPAHQIYNVGSGMGYTLSELLNKILSTISVPVQVVVDTLRVRNQDSTYLVADISKIKSVIPSLHNTYSIEQTLVDLVNYWRQRLSN